MMKLNINISAEIIGLKKVIIEWKTKIKLLLFLKISFVYWCTVSSAHHSSTNVSRVSDTQNKTKNNNTSSEGLTPWSPWSKYVCLRLLFFSDSKTNVGKGFIKEFKKKKRKKWSFLHKYCSHCVVHRIMIYGHFWMCKELI